MINFLNVFISLLLLGCTSTPEVLFEDHFDGSSLNETFWNYELGDGCPNLCGWGNNERQLYTKNNVSVSGGNLVITASKNGTRYESGRLTTKGKVEFQYGIVEVRATLPKGMGLWPAVWMLGADIDTNKWPKCGEIDIMEHVGKEPNAVFSSLHTPESYGNTIHTKKTIIDGIQNDFHIYKAIWSEDAIKFLIDGELVYEFSPEIKDDSTWPYNKPFYLIMNLAIGGNFGGPEVDDSIFPQEFLIDYIKVQQL